MACFRPLIPRHVPESDEASHSTGAITESTLRISFEEHPDSDIRDLYGNRKKDLELLEARGFPTSGHSEEFSPNEEAAAPAGRPHERSYRAALVRLPPSSTVWNTPYTSFDFETNVPGSTPL